MPYHTLQDGTRLYYEDCGQGPPVLLIHGFLMSHALWTYQTLHFREAHRLIVPDLRGHGDSDRTAGSYAPAQHAADLAELIEALDLPSVAVVGWSMGVLITAALYQRCPERIRGLALIDGAVCHLARPDYPLGRPPELHAQNLAAIRTDYPGLVRAFVESIFYRDVGPATRDWVERIALRVPAWIAYDQWSAMGQTDLRSVLPSIEVPTVVLHGKEDSRIGWPVAAWLAERIKGARLALLDGVGHTPFVEDQRLFNATMTDWLAECA